MTDRALLIANPAAGGGRCGRLLDAAVRRVRDGGLPLDVQRTDGPGHATQLAAAAVADGRPLVLSAGGDGTFFEVLNGVMPATGPRPALGAIPLGTGNSFLRDFQIRDADAAFTALRRGVRRRVDVIRAEHTTGQLWFINLLSLGFVSGVGAMTNRRFKPLGPAGYAVATVIGIARLRYHTIPVSLDGGPTDAAPVIFYSFNNSRCTGGDMQMAPNARVDDGQIDVIRVGAMSRLQLLATFPRIYQGRHLENPVVTEDRAAEVQLDLPGPVDLMVDGEILTHHLTRLVIEPGAVEVIA